MKRNPICVQPKGEKMNKFLKITERNKIEIMQVLPSDSYTSKLALYFQNFADQTRIKILSALSIQDLCVNDLSKIFGEYYQQFPEKYSQKFDGFIEQNNKFKNIISKT